MIRSTQIGSFQGLFRELSILNTEMSKQMLKYMIEMSTYNRLHLLGVK